MHLAAGAGKDGGRSMTLHIKASWHQPLELASALPKGIYACPKIDLIPEEMGVYIFGRSFGDNAVPLYVGRAKNLRTRLKQHLNFSTKLMLAILNAEAGARFFLFCTITGKSPKKLKTLESALISYLLGEDYELLNKHGVKKPNHTVTFVKNNQTSLGIVPRRGVRLQAAP
jgi:hypothetical protein